MRVYVSVDMEGIAGISHHKPTGRGDSGYPAAVALMVGEANAAIDGAYLGGATEVLVNDSHGGMYNLSPEEIDPRARLAQGQKAYSMVEAAREGRFDVAIFGGYHTRAGHPRGTIAHTYSGAPTLTTLGGRPVGETGLNAMYLGGLGVRVGMVAGDDALAEEVEEWLPWAERVVVKRAIGGVAAESMHPSAARDAVRDGARRAVERATSGEPPLQPLRLEPPVVGTVEFHWPSQADYAAVMPAIERYGDRGIRFRSDDPIEAYRLFLCAVRLAGLVDA